VHRATRSRGIDTTAEGDKVDGRRERREVRENESLAITAVLLLRSMVANLYDKQSVLGAHACNLYTYTYVVGVLVNKHPSTNNARPCHLGPPSRVTVSR